MSVTVSVVGEYNGAQIDRAMNQLTKLKTQVSGHTSAIGSAFQKMGSALGSVVGRLGSALASSGIVLWLKDSVKAATDAQVVQARLATSVKAAGGSWDKLAPSVEKNLSAMMRFSGFSKESLSSALADLVQRTGSVTKAQNLMGLAMDVARAKGEDVTSAASQIGLVLAGNTRILKQFGIEAVKPNTKGLDAQQKAAQLTAIRLNYLKDIQAKASGQAAAYGNTAAGAQAKFNASLQALQVTVGTQILPYLAQFMGFLSGLIAKFDAAPKATKGLVIGIAAVAGAALAANAAFGPIGLVAVLVGAAGLFIYKNWDKVRGIFTQVMLRLQPIITAGKQVWTVLAPIFSKVAAIVKDSLAKAFDNLKQAWAQLAPMLKPLMPILKVLGTILLISIAAPIAVVIAAVVAGVVVLAKLVQGFTWVIKEGVALGAWLQKLGPLIVNAVVGAFTTAYKHCYLFQHIVDAVTGAWTTIRKATTTAWTAVTTTLSGIWNSIVSVVTTVVAKVTAPIKAMISQAASWGSGVISGMVSGLTGGLKAIEDAGRTLAGKLIDAVKSFLGIHSPSTVFQALGGHVVGGFVNGLNFSNALQIVKSAFGGIWGLASNVPSLLSSIFDSGDTGVIASALKNVRGLTGGFGSVARGLVEAMSMVGKPYVWGAMSQAAADCSGLVSLVLQSMGLGYGRLTTATIPGALEKGRGKEVSVGLVPGHHTGIEFFNKLAFEAKGKKWGILGPDTGARTSWPEWYHPKGFMRGGISSGPGSGYAAVLHGTEAIIPLARRFRSQAIALIPQVLDSLGVGSAGPQLALAGGTSIHVASGAVQVSVTAAPGCTVAEAQRAGDTAAKAFMERLIREKRAL